MKQSQIIIKLAEEAKDWIPSYDFVKRATKWGWLGTSGDRRARELVEAGLLERKEEGQYAYFRLKLKEPQQLSML